MLNCRCRYRRNSSEIDWAFREKTSKAIFSYLKQISIQPNLDDLLTVGNMIKRAYGDDLTGIMADFLPGPTGIATITERLTSDEQDAARDFYASLSRSAAYKRLMQTYGWASGMSGEKGEYKFYNPRAFQEALQEMMQGDYFYPAAAAALINNNEHLADLVNIDLVNEFVDWANQKNRELASQPSLGNVLADTLRKAVAGAYLEIPEEAPPEVRQVGELMLMSARKAQEPSDAVYINQQDNEWVLGDNYERGYSFLIFREGVWYIRDSRTGDDSLIRDGIAGAERWAANYYRAP